MKLFGIILLITITITLSDSFAQEVPNIDTSIVDKTTELMDKSTKVLEKTEQVVDKTSELADKTEGVTGQLGGGCLIATATYGSELAPQVQQLRELRDNQLLDTESGTNFMTLFNSLYYSFSPHIADLERESPIFREAVKLAITPMITSLSVLNHVEINSEQTVLGYGLGIIVLNVGMYTGIPVFSILVAKRLRIS